MEQTSLELKVKKEVGSYLTSFENLFQNLSIEDHSKEESKSTITHIDFLQLRENRQFENNHKVYESIINHDIKEFEKYSNKKEVDKILIELDISLDSLLQECIQNKILNKILSGRISKNSTRQGSIDEKIQLETCHNTSQKYGIMIEKLSVDKYRGTTDGEILEKSVHFDKRLKSFDGRVSGKMEGWLFAKVVFGTGGHQDNVFKEVEVLINWCIHVYKRKNHEIFIILIDGDNHIKVKKIQEKYKEYDLFLIVNHIQFQEYIVLNYPFISDSI
jgi:hypothetical protein